MLSAANVRQFGISHPGLADAYFHDASRLLGLADARTPVTGHSERVALLALSMAHVLRLGDRLQRILWLGAMLHDVGKSEIDEAVLSETDDLVRDPRGLICAHTELGQQAILRTGTLDERVAMIALQHHEHWDGSGYPMALKGGEILLEARIVTAADHYDMLLHGHRSRRPMPKYEALSYMLAHAGRAYDPLFVDILGTVG